MSRDLEEMLQARKFPVGVIYGPERTQREHYDTSIVVERDRDGGDSVEPAHGQQRNPRLMRTRMLGVEARVYARSSVAGARVNEHENFCDQIVDALVVAITEWGTQTRAGDIAFTESKYLTAEERADVETWPGVVYRLRFRVPRGVRALDFLGQGKPEAAPTGVASQTQVRQTGAPDNPPEIGCG